MKRSFKVSALCLYAALGLLVQGCGPETKITGMVLDDQAGAAVPGTAVLGMVWIEDAGKAKPAQHVEGLSPEEIDLAMEKDMKDRGLPVALSEPVRYYAREVEMTIPDGKYAQVVTDNLGRATKGLI